MYPNGFNEPLVVKLNKFDGSHIWHKRIPSLFSSGLVKSYAMDIQDSLICVTGENYTGIEFTSLIVSNNLHDYFLTIINDQDYAEYPISPASLKEVEINSIFVYPNPFKSHINVSSKQNLKKIDLYSLEGKLVYSTRANGLNTIIYPDIISGSYILVVTTDYSKTTTKINHL